MNVRRPRPSTVRTLSARPLDAQRHLVVVEEEVHLVLDLLVRGAERAEALLECLAPFDPELDFWVPGGRRTFPYSILTILERFVYLLESKGLYKIGTT